MDGTNSFLSIIVGLLLFTSFVKVTTALSIVRYGIGLTGFEFGIVTLVVACAVSVISSPVELREAGVSARVLFEPVRQQDGVVMARALVPYMRAHADPEVARILGESGAAQRDAHPVEGQGSQGKAAPAAAGEATATYGEMGEVGAVFVLSEIKAAVSAASLVLVPFIVIDLLVAHLIALLGIQHLSTHLVSFPLKLLLFVAVDGWTLLVAKLIGS